MMYFIKEKNNKMLSLSEIIEIIKDKKGLKKDKDVANLLKIEAKQFATAKSRNSIPHEELTSFCNKEGWSLNWLLTGQGPQYLEEKGKVVSPGDAEVPEGFIEIDVYTLAGAGNARELAGHEPITSICIPKDFYQPSIKPVIVQGDSMYPTILDGAIVGVAENDKKIISGKIYAIYLPYEGAVIKRLFVDKDKVVLKPDNTLFPITEIPFTEIQNDPNFFLGRVKWVVQKL